MFLLFYKKLLYFISKEKENGNVITLLILKLEMLNYIYHIVFKYVICCFVLSLKINIFKFVNEIFSEQVLFAPNAT